MSEGTSTDQEWSPGTSFRVYAARFVSRTGGEAAFFVGIWGKAAYTFDASPAGLAVLMAALGVAGLVGSALAGMLVDRHGPKRVLVVSEMLFVPAAISGAFTQTLPQLVAVAALIGLFGAPTMTAISSFPPYMTAHRGRLARLNAGVETAGMAAFISGTASGALLGSTLGLDSIFWFDALTSIIGVLLVLPVMTARVPTGSRTRGRNPTWKELREGFGHVYTSRALRFYVLAGTSLWLLFGLFSGLEPLFYRDVLDQGPATIGWVNTIFGIGLVAGTLVAGRLPQVWRGARIVAFLLAVNGLAASLYVGTASLVVVVAGAAVWGVMIGLFVPTVRTLIHLQSPARLVGRIMGTTQVHNETARLLPLAAAPLLAAAVGVQSALVLAGVALAAFASVSWRSASTIDRGATEPSQNGQSSPMPAESTTKTFNAT